MRWRLAAKDGDGLRTAKGMEELFDDFLFLARNNGISLDEGKMHAFAKELGRLVHPKESKEWGILAPMTIKHHVGAAATGPSSPATRPSAAPGIPSAAPKEKQPSVDQKPSEAEEKISPSTFDAPGSGSKPLSEEQKKENEQKLQRRSQMILDMTENVLRAAPSFKQALMQQNQEDPDKFAALVESSPEISDICSTIYFSSGVDDEKHKGELQKACGIIASKVGKAIGEAARVPVADRYAYVMSKFHPILHTLVNAALMAGPNSTKPREKQGEPKVP